MDTGSLYRQFDKQEARVGAIAITPDSNHIISGSDDYFVKIWEISTGNVVKYEKGNSRVLSIKISPNGKKFAVNTLISLNLIKVK